LRSDIRCVLFFIAADDVLQVRIRVRHAMLEERLAIVLLVVHLGLLGRASTFLRRRSHAQMRLLINLLARYVYLGAADVDVFYLVLLATQQIMILREIRLAGLRLISHQLLLLLQFLMDPSLGLVVVRTRIIPCRLVGDALL
jgi:hypothetical protein